MARKGGEKMIQKFMKPKNKKVGGDQEEFDLAVEPIPVQIRRPLRERVTDALILVAIAVAAQVIVALVL
jgi:hypothetical protein